MEQQTFKANQLKLYAMWGKMFSTLCLFLVNDLCQVLCKSEMVGVDIMF